MDNIILNTINDEMGGLNNLPKVDSFLGLLDLKTGSMIISALCVFHPMVYGCTFFMPKSYLFLTIWILLLMFFAASIVLFVGLINNDTLLIDLWIWYTLVFIVIMLMLMFLLILVFCATYQKAKLLVVILGILWYILTVYFLLVVNSHREALIDSARTTRSKESSQSQYSPQSPDPAKIPDTADPSKDPDGTDLQKDPDATDPQKDPDATDPQKDPDATDPQKDPDATDPQKDPDATDPQKDPDDNPGFRRGRHRLKAFRKASAKSDSKQ